MQAWKQAQALCSKKSLILTDWHQSFGTGKGFFIHSTMIVPFLLCFYFCFLEKTVKGQIIFSLQVWVFFFRKSFQFQTDSSAPVCTREFHFKLLKKGLLLTVCLFTPFRCLKEHFPSGYASILTCP